MRRTALILALALTPLAVHARDGLGVFSGWAAFRDPETPRCYAIAQPDRNAPGERRFQPYADVADYPRQALRGAFHLRLARPTAPGAPITLLLGGQKFALVGGGGDAWAVDARMDAAITAAMRSAPGMSVSARDAAGHPLWASWKLTGAATAIDAALLGCAALR